MGSVAFMKICCEIVNRIFFCETPCTNMSSIAGTKRSSLQIMSSSSMDLEAAEQEITFDREGAKYILNDIA